MSRLPDFIVIGAMKCATTTLHRQLDRQPGFFMSRPKEPNFFSDDEIYARGLAWYGSLFRAAGDVALCGESSTHYTKLPTYSGSVARMRQVLPRVRLIYIMRDPVDRLVSQYVHEVISDQIKVPADEAIERHPELVAYSRYALQLRPYLEAFGPANVLPVFFEGLVARPQAELERIGRFLGAAGRLEWDHALGPQNTSRDLLRKSLLRDAVVNAPVLSTIRRKLVPKPLSEQVKALWRSNAERPELSRRSLERLRAVFDEDLAQLGVWLGVEVDSARFREVALTGPHEWAGA
jgi:hypothetical protein